MIKLAICCVFYNNYNELKRQLESYLPYAYDVIDHFIYIDGVYKHLANKDKSPLSNDVSRTLLLDQFDYCDILHKLTLYDYPNKSEYDKRNEYLNICNRLNVDAMIILDSDEYFDYNPSQYYYDIYQYKKECWPNLKKMIQNRIEINNMMLVEQRPKDRFSQLPISNNVYIFPFLDHGYHLNEYIEQDKPRLWLNPGDMSYCYNSHYHYYNKKEEQPIKDYYDANKLKYCQPHHSLIDLSRSIRIKHDHLLSTNNHKEQRELYTAYIAKYESLVQNGFTDEEAEELISNLSDELINKILNR